jgi:hypothetical protein
MSEPKVELKNIKIFRGNEGYGMNANIYVNGVKTAFIIDSANGGCFDYEIVQTPQAKGNFKLLEDYIKTLPKMKTDTGKYSGIYEITMDMDLFIDSVMKRQEKSKFEAKKQKLFEIAVVFGSPDGNSYRSCKFKQPLKDYATVVLQRHIDDIKAKILKPDEIIFNTNLEALGIKI